MPQGIPEGIVDEIRQRSDLVGVVGDYLALEKKGRNMVGICPFHHEKTPSFTVSPEKQLYHCFGCGESGNVFNFIMKMENISFPEAARLLARRVGVTIPERGRADTKAENLKERIYTVNLLAARFFAYSLWQTAAGKKAVDYLKKRGIDRNTGEMFMLGYAPRGWDSFLEFARKKGFSPQFLEQAGLVSSREGGGYYDRFRHRLIFPIFNLRGKIIGFGGRQLEEEDKAGPKYLNSPETAVFSKSAVLYGLNLARDEIRRVKTAVVVEGYTDVIAAHQAGMKNVVASQGTALTAAQGRLLRSQAETVIIAYDADSAGEAATWRGLGILKEAGCLVKVAELPAGSDPDSLIREKGIDSFAGLVKEARPLVDYRLAKLRERCGTGSAEGRLRYSREVLPVLLQERNLVERDYYLKQVAEELGISEEALRSEMRKYRQKAMGANNLALKDQTNNINQLGVNPAEKLLLSLMFQGEGIASLAKSRLALEDFQHDLTRRAVKEIWNLESAGAAVNADALINLFTEPQAHALITQAATDPSVQDLTPETMERMARDCIEKIRQVKLDLQRRELQQKLKMMEKQGLSQQARNLLREQWQMIVQKNRGAYRSGGGEDYHG